METESSSGSHITLVSSDDCEFHLSLCAVEREECGYVRGLLRSGMRECDQRRVQLPVISGANLQTAVNFLHGDAITLDVNTVQEVLETATYLQIPGLLQKCGQFLSQNWDVENITDIIDIVRHFSMQELVERAEDYLHCNIPQFSDTSGFLSMDSDDVIRLLASSDLEVKEIDVFKAVIKWLKNNQNERLADMLKVVRFPLLTVEELSEARRLVEELFPVDHDLKEKFDEASHFHEDPYLLHEKGSISTGSRRTVTSVIAIGGFTGTEHSTNRFQQWPVHRLDSLSSERTMDFRSGKAEKLPTTLCEHSACVLDNFLYVAGGQTQYCQDGRYTSNTVYRYDPRFSTWMQVRVYTPSKQNILDVKPTLHKL